MTFKRTLYTLLLLLIFTLPASAIADSVSVAGADSTIVNSADSTSTASKVSPTYWIKQLKGNGFRIHDPEVRYPAVPRFILSVYDWGDRTFNSYDTDYVVGTGKKWKFMFKSYNWLGTSTMQFPDDVTLDMHSHVFSNAGFRINFMAVSVGYMWNMNKLFSKPASRHTFDFSFNTSRFAINYQSMKSNGGMIITRLGDYTEDHGHLRYKFDDVSINSRSADVIYFFRHRTYSHAAAYVYSKYQLKSAGTPLIGFSWTEQKIHMDFSSLPDAMKEYIPEEWLYYSSHYRSYCLSGGYSYNWVLHPRRWLINAYGIGAIGYRNIVDTRKERDTRELIAHQLQLSTAVVYNHKALFASATIRFQGFLNYNSAVLHFNTFPSFTLATGIRF